MSEAVLNPKTVHKEFFGVPGAFGISFGLPALVIFFALIANETYSLQGVRLELDKVAAQLPQTWDQIQAFCFDHTCWTAYLTWFFGLAAFDQIVPGKHLKGVKLADGTQLDYKINGLLFVSVFLVVFLARLYQSDNYYLPELDFLYKNHLKLTVVTILFSYGLSTFVFITSYIPLRTPNGVGSKERILSINGNSESYFYNWFIGRELNPRIGSWDIKLFCELKPGLLLWCLINLSCIHNQYHEFGKVTDSLILVNVLQSLYILDGVLNEEGVLTMMDVVTDGFGFMLCFGDLTWVPYTYSIQSRFLSLPQNFYELGPYKTTAILLLNLLGFYIFKASNIQKSDFRRGKLENSNLQYIQTKSGTKLLCDGWWSKSQHMNYFGDWIVGWSWCLPTGFQTLFTYFYVIYFGSLLVHRQIRDETKCKEKYGEYWVKYQKQVPYKIIPYIY